MTTTAVTTGGGGDHGEVVVREEVNDGIIFSSQEIATPPRSPPCRS